MKIYFPIFILKCRKTAPKPSDKVDNDCDGKTDEEIIDGKDNDGDGFIDEDYVKVRVTKLLGNYLTITKKVKRFCGHLFIHSSIHLVNSSS